MNGRRSGQEAQNTSGASQRGTQRVFNENLAQEDFRGFFGSPNSRAFISVGCHRVVCRTSDARSYAAPAARLHAARPCEWIRHSARPMARPFSSLSPFLVFPLVFALFSLFATLGTPVFIAPYAPRNSSYITFGQSVALTGPSRRIGLEFHFGLSAAFAATNAAGGLGLSDDGLHERRNVTLLTKDDMYEPGPCFTNTEELVENPDVFALIGYAGTPTTKSILPILHPDEATTTYPDPSESSDDDANADELHSMMPLIGPLTGARFLRLPFRPCFVNIRASYDDEVVSMIEYLVRDRHVFSVGLLLQNDSFGDATLYAALRALEPYDVSLVAVTHFPRNWDEETGSEDFATVVESMILENPGAVIMGGTYGPLAAFVAEYVQACASSSDKLPLFLSVSFVGSIALAEQLEQFGVDLATTEVIVTQVVPPFDDESNYPHLVHEYRAALALINSSHPPSFVSFEGYIVGRFAVAALQGIYGHLSREGFVDSVYGHRNFLLDELEVGEFRLPESENDASGCNQGGSGVWPTRILSVNKFVLIESGVYRWRRDSCLTQTSHIPPQLRFSQSVPLSGLLEEIGRAYYRGIDAAFFSYNRRQSMNSRLLRVVTVDDGYDPEICRQNTEGFLADNRTFALVGYLGTPTAQAILPLLNSSNVPFIGFGH